MNRGPSFAQTRFSFADTNTRASHARRQIENEHQTAGRDKRKWQLSAAVYERVSKPGNEKPHQVWLPCGLQIHTRDAQAPANLRFVQNIFEISKTQKRSRMSNLANFQVFLWLQLCKKGFAQFATTKEESLSNDFQHWF